MSSYIVNPFKQPKTAVLTAPAGAPMQCPICGNENQEKFWTVTSMAGTELQGAVCAPCEERAATRRL